MSARKAAPTQGGASSRSVMYASSPLLASKTPPWRSKFLVAIVGVSFCILLGRAVFVQLVDAPFFQRQGEARYARTLELPASRGRITDRNGLILAASLPVPSLWAIPKDMDADPAERARLAKALGMTPKELAARIGESQNFAWLRRQIDDRMASTLETVAPFMVGSVRVTVNSIEGGRSMPIGAPS